MPKLRDAIAFAYGSNAIDDMEYVLLYDATKPKNRISRILPTMTLIWTI